MAGSAWLFALLAACGTATPPEAKSSDDKRASQVKDTSAGPCVRERARAAELAQVAEAATPPDVPPLDGKLESLAFISGPMAEWVKAARAAVDEADDAHAMALACMPSGERGGLLLGRGRLQGHFVTTFLRLGEAAMPPQFMADAEMKRAMLGGLTDAVKPHIERARSSFEQCVALGNEAAPADVSACSAELTKLPQQPASSASVGTASAARSKPSMRVAYPRPFVDTSQPKPCTFAGTLRLWHQPLSIGSREVARMEQVELNGVTLPPTRSGPFIIETAWPVRGTFALPVSALPFNLRSRVDLVAKNVWLSEGAAVSAAAAPGGALAFRPLGEGAAAKPDPAVKIACSELELAGRVEPKEDGAKQDYVSFKGALALADAPGGQTVGNLTLSKSEAFVLLGRKNGWLHIQNLGTPFRGFHHPLPYDFDAWTQSRPTDETSWGMIGVFNPTTPPTHTSTGEIALYVDPSSAQPVGKLVKDVPLLLGETRGQFVNIIVPGLDAAEPNQTGFWADRHAVNASVRAL
jgi:hypothetical protein